ncbi:MAG TPA: hypothetical protein VMJ75_27675 [Candidatus Acidoferrales bacterium]|nr:hypothetical protein [Candidatus Acidoferrales bacterium]
MDLIDWQSDIQHLRDLARKLGLEHAAAALAAAGESAPERRDQWIRAACEGMLQEIALRQGSLPARRGLDKWERCTPGLAGLEQMSWREMAHVQDSATRCAASARATAENLPAMLWAKCRGALAAAALSPADLSSTGSEQFLARLRRRLAGDIDAAVCNVAMQIQRDVLRELVTATESMYGLACATEEILRAMRYGTSIGYRPSLSGQLKERRTAWQMEARSLESRAPAAEAGFQAGALFCGLGAVSMAAGLEALSSSQLPPLSPFGEFKEALMGATYALMQREWETKRCGILNAVDAHVTESFARLTRSMDEGFLEMQREMAAPGNSSSREEEQVETTRLEVREILRHAGGGSLWEKSA